MNYCSTSLMHQPHIYVSDVVVQEASMRDIECRERALIRAMGIQFTEARCIDPREACKAAGRTKYVETLVDYSYMPTLITYATELHLQHLTEANHI